MRVITSAPKGCCLFSMEATATGAPVFRSRRVATTVVVPRSKAIAYRIEVVSPGSISMSSCSINTAVTLKSDLRKALGRWRMAASETVASKSSISSKRRTMSVR